MVPFFYYALPSNICWYIWIKIGQRMYLMRRNKSFHFVFNLGWVLHIMIYFVIKSCRDVRESECVKKPWIISRTDSLSYSTLYSGTQNSYILVTEWMTRRFASKLLDILNYDSICMKVMIFKYLRTCYL